MRSFDLDGTTITSVTIFHLVIAEQGGFPSYYGRNFDAFWDCMTTDVEGPITFTWKNHKLSALFTGPATFIKTSKNI